MTVDKRDLYERLKDHLPGASGKEVGPPTMPGPGRPVWGFCPGHADGLKSGKRSLRLSPEAGLECFAGCTRGKEGFKRIADMLDGGLQPEFKAPIPIKRPRQGKSLAALADLGTCVAVYEYTVRVNTPGCAAGTIFEKGRFEKDGSKQFLWRKKGEERWGGFKQYGIELTDFGLYDPAGRIDRTPGAKVVFVEGEKAADACIERGLLATCGPWSASQKDFGDLGTFDLLKGRDVWIWPDNDVPGLDYARFVYRSLQGIAAKRHYVNVPLKEKEDAHDYFHKHDGKVEAIFEGTLEKISVEPLSGESFRATVPTASGKVQLLFTGIAREGKSLNCELAVRTLIPGSEDEVAFSAHIDLMSLSNIDSFRRSLDKYYGEKWEWVKVLNEARSHVIDRWRNRDRAEDVADIEDDGPQQYHIEGLVPLDDITVVFGTGSSTKSFQVYGFALACALGQPWCGLETVPGPVLVIDYETTRKNFKRRMRRLAQNYDLETVPPQLVYRWQGYGSLKDQEEAIKNKILKAGIRMVIVDSAVPACGGEPEKAHVASAFFDSLRALGVTVIVIAHVAKDADTIYPFGSIFFHNLARATYWIDRNQKEDSPEVLTQWVNRKTNDGRKKKPYGVRVAFEDPDGPVWMEPSDPDEVHPEQVPLERRLLKCLAGGSMAIYEIENSLDLSPDEKRVLPKALSQGVQKGLFVQMNVAGVQRFGLPAPKNFQVERVS